MDKAERDEIKQAIMELFKEYEINSLEEFEELDEETGAELYEYLKAEVLEVYDVDLELVNELTDEILDGE